MNESTPILHGMGGIISPGGMIFPDVVASKASSGVAAEGPMFVLVFGLLVLVLEGFVLKHEKWSPTNIWAVPTNPTALEKRTGLGWGMKWGWG